MSKKEMVVKFLKELDNSDRAMSMEELGLDQNKYVHLLEIMQMDKLIYGVYILKFRKQIIAIKTDNIKITLSGIEYLEFSKLDMTNIYNRTITAFD